MAHIGARCSLYSYQAGQEFFNRFKRAPVSKYPPSRASRVRIRPTAILHCIDCCHGVIAVYPTLRNECGHLCRNRRAIAAVRPLSVVGRAPARHLEHLPALPVNMTRPRSSQGYGNNMAALCRAWLAVKTQASSSFSENRTKKQSPFCDPRRRNTRLNHQKFLLLFSKRSASFLLPPTHRLTTRTPSKPQTNRSNRLCPYPAITRAPGSGASRPRRNALECFNAAATLAPQGGTHHAGNRR
jgi:hypothetical protein